MDRIWPFAEVHAAGALVAAGSDWPVAAPAPDPWPSLGAMVTAAAWIPPSLEPSHAARHSASAPSPRTVNAAWAAGLAKETGRLSPGMSADFIIPDRDLFTIPVEEIHATQVGETWFSGRLVHDATARR